MDEPTISQPEPPAPDTFTKRFHFISGFVGWFVINGCLWTVAIGRFSSMASILQLFCFPGNILTLIFLLAVRNKRWIGWGILAAWAINLILALIFGILATNGQGRIPFGPGLLPFFIEFGF